MWEEYHNHGTHNYSNEYDFMGLLTVNRFCILKT